MIRRICYYGASGYRKSTWAMETTALLNKAGLNAHYVSEEAKNRVLRGYAVPTHEDQIAIGSIQYESELIGLRNYPLIVTDSPIHLASIYAQYYSGEKGKLASYILSLLGYYMDANYPALNILLDEPPHYDDDNRWQNRQEAQKVQSMIVEYARTNSIPLIRAHSPSDVVDVVFSQHDLTNRDDIP